MTFDLDLLIEATPDNARKLLDALVDAGLGTASLIEPKELLDNEITVFKDVIRIDVQTSTPGIEFSDVWNRRETVERGEMRLFVLSKNDLIAAKRASGRQVDLDDVKALEPDKDE